jgi:hypothetical protein
MANLLSTTVNGGVTITDGTNGNSFYKGGNFVNPRDTWDNFHIHGGAHGSMYFDSASYNFRPSNQGTPWLYIDANSARFRTYAADTAYSIRIESGNQFDAYYGDNATTMFINWNGGQTRFGTGGIRSAGDITADTNIWAANGNGRIALGGNLHIDSYNGNDIYLNYYTNRPIRLYGDTYVNATSFLSRVITTGRLEVTYNADRYQVNLNRSSGSNWWITNDSDKIGFHIDSVGDRFYFATDGNIWSAYYNDWLSNVLASKVSTSGGQTIAGTTYFSGVESLNLYGIRGAFTNEYIHLYHKVGIGHPGGWGQGEGNTPGYGLSTYGGATIAYGNSAGMYVYGSISTDTYVHTNASVRVGEIWGHGGLYRGSGDMMFGTEGGHWYFNNSNNTKAWISGANGDIWMSWSNEWLSNLLTAKQNASTAITTSNIGSQSVNYATSAGTASNTTSLSAVPFSGDEATAVKNTLGASSLPYKCDIYVDGDADTFYPVHFIWGDQDVWRRIIIKRGYSEDAPWDPIGTGAHHGGLLLDWEGNFGGWGGAEYSDRLRVFNESYTNVCADMYIYTHAMGYVFMLRGGHALYHIFSDQPIRGYHQTGTPDIAYSTSTLFYDHSIEAYKVYAPAPVTTVNSSRIDGLRTKKQSLLDGRYANISSWGAGSFFTGQTSQLSVENGGNFVRFAFNNLDFYDWQHGQMLSINDGVSTFSNKIAINDGNNYPLDLNGGAHKYLRIQPGNGYEAMVYYHGGTGSPWYVGKRTSSQTVGTDSFHFYSEAAGATVGGINPSGDMTVTGSMRAPIFYDSANTAFYLDPNGTSRLAETLTDQTYTYGWYRNYDSYGLYNQSHGNHFYATNDSQWNIAANGGTPSIAFKSGGYEGTLRGYVYADTGDNIGFLNNAGSWSLRTSSDRKAYIYGNTLSINVGEADWSSIFMHDGDEGTREIHCNSNRIGFLTQAGAWAAWNDDSNNWFANGYVQSFTSMYSPIYYDGNDSNYYVDPNSNSYLSTLRVADAVNGVSLNVGNGSTHGVYTADNARKYLVVSADYYPHMAIVASGSNNTNHGAVFSFVGTEGSSFRQWNLGISNQNPFLFSIGYNRNDDSNPHYGLGDGWHADDNNHARLSIDRDGNTKIRGMLYVNGTSGGISTGNAVIHAGNIGSQSVDYAQKAGKLWNTSSNGYYLTYNYGNELTAYDDGGQVTTMYLNYRTGGNVAIGPGGVVSVNSNGIYSPIFYDSADTSFYVDPNGSSVLHHVIPRVLRFIGEGGDSGNGSLPTSYGIYQQGGAWTSPYPDLCIGFHTGIKIGAHYNYGGTRFYNNSDWVTEIFSVGNGDNNVRAAGNIYAGGSLNGTGFYGNSVNVGTAGSTPTTDYGIFHQSGVGLGIVSAAGGSNQGISFWSHSGSSYFESVRIAGSTGNVGIGTTSPGDYKLYVNGGQFGTLLRGGDLGTGSDVVRMIKSDNSIAMLVRGDGNVGIGTTSPGYHLEVAGNAYVSNIFSTPNYIKAKSTYRYHSTAGLPGQDTPVKTASGVLATFGGNGGSFPYIIIKTRIPQDQYNMGGFTIDLFADYYSSNRKTTISLGGYWNPESNGGFEGFEYNTTNPNVRPDITVMRDITDGMTCFVISGMTWSYPKVIARDLFLGHSSADIEGGLDWSIFGADDLGGYINNDAVICRNALPADQWYGNTYIHYDGRHYGTIFYDSNDSAYYCDPNATSRLHIIKLSTDQWNQTSDGYNRFYFGNNARTYFGSGNGYEFRSAADANIASISNAGDFVAAGDVTAYSDARIKTNVQTIENALDKTLKLRGVTYTRTDSEDTSTKVGVIAQEILEVIPEVVKQNDEGMYSVSYGNLTAVLIEAIKEQQKQIDELKEIINGFTK